MQLAFEIPILAYDLWTYKKGNHNTITCVCILADHFFVCGLLSIKEDVMVLVIISLVSSMQCSSGCWLWRYNIEYLLRQMRTYEKLGHLYRSSHNDLSFCWLLEIQSLQVFHIIFWQSTVGNIGNFWPITKSFDNFIAIFGHFSKFRAHFSQLFNSCP